MFYPIKWPQISHSKCPLSWHKWIQTKYYWCCGNIDHATLQSVESAISAWIRNGEEERFLQKKVVDVKFVLRNTSLINATSFISLYFLNWNTYIIHSCRAKYTQHYLCIKNLSWYLAFCFSIFPICSFDLDHNDQPVDYISTIAQSKLSLHLSGTLARR